jgi:glycosyltransferase involved in cell wall biosynthesis
VRLLYILRGGRAERLRLAEGAYPDEFFYGFRQMARRPGWRADLWERNTQWTPGRILQRGVHALTNLSPDFGGAPHLDRNLLSDYDVVVSTSEPVLMMLALRRPAVTPGAGLVLILMGAEKRLQRSRLPYLTTRLLRWALARMAAVIVVGEGEREYLVGRGLVEPGRVHLVHFGVDVRFWTPGPESDGRSALAVGNDDGRDYGLLLRAIGAHPLRLHTHLPVNRLDLAPTVELTGGSWQDASLSDEQLRELYRQSRFVVVPLRESAQPQGQSVTLQAMACGKAVILTRTRGLWGAGLMRHGENCHLVPAGDAEALREGIERLSTDGAYRAALGETARRTVEEHFTSDRMADEIATIVESARP